MLTFKVKAAIRHTAIFAGVAVLSIPVAEVAFRVFGDRPSDGLRGLYAGFGDASYRHAPEVNTEALLASGRLVVRTDKLGMRCDPESKFGTKPGDSIDFLLVGDSQGFGNGVNFEETIAGTLATLATQSGKRVANSSIGGHSLISQQEVLQKMVAEQGLRVKEFVILATPVLVNKSDKPSKASVGKDGMLYGAGPIRRSALLRNWLKTHAVVYSRIRDAVRNLGVEPANEAPSVLQFYSATGGTGEVASHLTASLRAFHAFASSNGASVSLAYLPSTIEAEPKELQAAANKLGLKVDLDLPAKRCEIAARETGLPLYDLRPALKLAHQAGWPLNVKADFHYSPELSRACATNLSLSLKLTSPIPNSSNPNTVR